MTGALPLANALAMQAGLEKAGIATSSAELSRVPTTQTRVEGKEAESCLKLIEMLEEHDDVQKVYANFDIPKAEMERISNLS